MIFGAIIQASIHFLSLLELTGDLCTDLGSFGV